MEPFQQNKYLTFQFLNLKFFLMAVLVFNGVPYCCQASSVVVDAPFAKIRGVRKIDEKTGQSLLSFKGIPYAKPPLGELRFAKPQPHPQIEGIFDATNEKRIICPHPDKFQLAGFGDSVTEDCLVLDVLSPDIDPMRKPLKKVLVFIHGGGFVGGSGSFYNATSFVLSQDIIVVTINYRLGVLGFLSLENEASPGNYGLWDQNLALIWVKENIRAFGGDPDDVTIAGESAGGASVGYHMISTHSKGLFTKAYPQSGTATSGFARTIKPQSLSLELAKSLNCSDKEVDYKLNVQESQEIIRCMRELPLSAITSYSDFSVSKQLFLPVLDQDFISDTPEKLLGDDAYLESVDFFRKKYLIALDNDERGILANFLEFPKSVIFMNNETSAEDKEKTWQALKGAANRLNMLTRVGEEGLSKQHVVDAINAFYNRRFADSDTALIEFISDMYFLIPTIDFALATSRRADSDAYLLYFDHFPEFMVPSKRRGTTHGIDLLYWFDLELADIDSFLGLGLGIEMSQEDLDLKRTFSSLIGDFVRSGNPGQSLNLDRPWPKYDTETGSYLKFGPRPFVNNFLESDKQEFWLKTVPMLMQRQNTHSHTEL